MCQLLNFYCAQPWPPIAMELSQRFRGFLGGPMPESRRQIEPHAPQALQAQPSPPPSVRGEMQHVAASIPQSAGSPPVQVIIQNSAGCETRDTRDTQRNDPPPPKLPQHLWEVSRQDLADLWASPLNRVCLLGLAGFALWIYHAQAQHQWRMFELQRRIDSNPLMRLVAQVLGPSKWPK